MPSTRRAFAGTVAALALTAGCVGGGTAPDEWNDAARGDESASADGSASADESTSEGTRGEAAAISVSETVDDVEYVPGNETVEIVAAYRHANRDAVQNGSEPPEREPVYAEIPWDRWAATECASVAGRAVHDVLTDRLGADHGASVGVGSRGDGGLAVVVGYTTLYDRGGDRISETAVGFDRLAAATPREVTATVTLDGRTATRTVPARVRYSEMRQE